MSLSKMLGNPIEFHFFACYDKMGFCIKGLRFEFDLEMRELRILCCDRKETIGNVGNFNCSNVCAALRHHYYLCSELVKNYGWLTPNFGEILEEIRQIDAPTFKITYSDLCELNVREWYNNDVWEGE